MKGFSGGMSDGCFGRAFLDHAIFHSAAVRSSSQNGFSTYLITILSGGFVSVAMFPLCASTINISTPKNGQNLGY